MVIQITCWKWFDGVLKDAGVKVTNSNKEKIDEVLHKYINEQISYGHCSPNWSKARKEVSANEKMRKELVEKLRPLA